MYSVGAVIVGWFLAGSGQVVHADGVCRPEQWQTPRLARSYNFLGVEGFMMIPLDWHVADNNSQDYPSLTVQSRNGVVMQVLATDEGQSLSWFVGNWVENYRQSGFSEQVEVQRKSVCIKGAKRPAYEVKITDIQLGGQERVEVLEMEAQGRKVFITIWSPYDARESWRDMHGLLQASRLN